MPAPADATALPRGALPSSSVTIRVNTRSAQADALQSALAIGQPEVDVFIPTYNEDREILALTVAAAKAMDYPSDRFTVYLLDDGGTDQKRNSDDPVSAAKARERAAILKDLCSDLGAVYMTRAENVHANAAELGLPVVVKPANEGSSVGISRVTDDAGLDEAVALAARYDGQLLMEQMVVGDELTVGILGDVALPSIRIVPKGEWYDYNAKYIADDTQYLCPGLDGGDEEEIRRIALAAFRAAGCRGWGRVDVMRDRSSGRFFLLEVNTAPGMTSHSLVPKAARQVGIGFEELCWRVLETSLPKEGAGA